MGMFGENTTFHCPDTLKDNKSSSFLQHNDVVNKTGNFTCAENAFQDNIPLYQVQIIQLIAILLVFTVIAWAFYKIETGSFLPNIKKCKEKLEHIFCLSSNHQWNNEILEEIVTENADWLEYEEPTVIKPLN